MAKTKPMANTGEKQKQSLKTLKHGTIQKKKNPKYKMTPTGKVNLINGPKAQNNHKNKQQKQFQKGLSASPDKSPKHNNSNKGFAQGKNNKNKQLQSPQSQANQKKHINQLVPANDEYDSDSDDNVGVTLQEEVSMIQDGSMEEEDDSNDDVPDIFGTSLAEDSDEDDEDFEEDDSDEEEQEDEEMPPKENKGVKMFGGVKLKAKSTDSKSLDESLELDTSSSAKNSSMTSNDDDDDDEEEGDEDENDNEEDGEDDEDGDGSEDDEEDDDDDDEEEDEDDEEECGPGLKDLLSNSLVDDDDDDDEDFEEEGEESEDEDISDEEEDEEANNSTVQTSQKKSNDKEEIEFPNKYEKSNSRTIFVGNLPVTTKKQQLKKLFKKYGPILTVRLRGIVPVEEKMSKKVAAITKQVHPKLKNIYGYVTFQNEESVKEAMAMNGQIYEGHYLRVDSTVKAQEANVDPKKSVFLGNLSFKADNNTIWEHFKDCGEIESVRIVKHNKTGVSKGIGYVNFKNADSVALALKLDGTELQNREIRVQKYSRAKVDSKPGHEGGQKRSRPQRSSTENLAKKFKTSLEQVAQNQKQHPQEKKGQHSQGNEASPQNKTAFQGQKADLKKKKKTNKMEKQKKIIAAKLAAKPKKPMH